MTVCMFWFDEQHNMMLAVFHKKQQLKEKLKSLDAMMTFTQKYGKPYVRYSESKPMEEFVAEVIKTGFGFKD